MTVATQRKRAWGYVMFAAWVGLVVYFTLPSFLWQVQYYKSPGPAFYKVFLVAAPLVAVLSALYARIRRQGLWKWEPLLFASLPLAAALFYEPWATVSCGLIVVSSYVAGRSLLGRLGLTAENPLGEWALCVGCGFGLFTLVLFAFGMLNLYRHWTFACIVGIPLVIGFRHLQSISGGLTRIQHAWESRSCLRSTFVGVAVFFAALFLVCALGMILAPTVAYDAMNYHLALAEWYVEEGGLQASGRNCYSYFPQTFETLSTWTYGLGGLPAAQFLGPVMLALSLALCAHIGRQCRWNPQSVVLGVIASSTIPFIHWTGSVPKNDLAMAFFQLAALSCYLSWRRDGNFRWIHLSAFLLGMSFGVKHTAVFSSLPLFLLGAYAILKQSRPFRALAYVVLILICSGALWHLRTFVLTGNPTYPENAQRALDAFNENDPNTAINSLRRYPQILWRAHTEGYRLFEAIIPAPLGIYLALFTPLVLLPPSRPGNQQKSAVAFFVLLATAYWLSQMSTLRYAIAPIILCPLLVSPRLVGLWQAAGRPVRAAILVVLMYSFVFSWSAIMIIENNGPQLQYLAGRIDKSSYLKRALAPYAVVEAVGNEAKPGDEILAVDSCAAVYAPESWRFHCRRIHGDKDTKLQLRAWLAERPYRFMILPNDLELPAELQDLQPTKFYEDSRYSAFRLQPLPVSASVELDDELAALIKELRGRGGPAPTACVF